MTKKTKPKRRTAGPYQHSYNAGAVQKAINASRKPIGKREASLIHRLLKGRGG